MWAVDTALGIHYGYAGVLMEGWGLCSEELRKMFDWVPG